MYENYERNVHPMMYRNQPTQGSMYPQDAQGMSHQMYPQPGQGMSSQMYPPTGGQGTPYPTPYQMLPQTGQSQTSHMYPQSGQHTTSRDVIQQGQGAKELTSSLCRGT